MFFFRLTACLLFFRFRALVLAGSTLRLFPDLDDYSDSEDYREQVDFTDLRDEAICPDTSGEVAASIYRYDRVLSAHGISLDEWDPFDTLDNLCRTGGKNGETGLRCGCAGEGRAISLECRGPPSWPPWQYKASWDLCMLSCNCRSTPDGLGSSRDAVIVEETNGAVEKGPGGTIGTEKKKSSWKQVWRKTKKLCGIQRCHGNRDCAGMSCGPTICRAISKTPGVYDNQGICSLSNSVLGLLGSSSLIGRSAGDEACPCNSSYVSNQCCWADNGLVWESADAKLGRLIDSDL